jgi:bifunctional lysine-specific demethylase and histidyl-hydroxylase MINA
MLFDEARQTWAEFLAPTTLEEFLDQTLSGGFRKLPGNAASARTLLLGPDPEALLGQAYELAPKLTFHSANPLGPAPALEGISDAAEFRRRIDEFHARHYSVRLPELRPLSPRLERLARALEMLLHQPVSASAFWSRGGMRAPVHLDDHDLLVVQLRGSKRWYLSNKPSELPNVWKSIPPDGGFQLGEHTIVDLTPGEMLYLPRGTLHSVDSDTASLHLSLGFTPLTLREALLAALDHLSDLDGRLRTSVGARLGSQLQGGVGVERLAPPVLEALEQLRGACRTPGFLAGALQRRSARAIAGLTMLPPPASAAAMTLDTALVQADGAFCHLTANPAKIDFTYPGGHVYIHRGVEESLVFMVNTPRFRVRDIPGPIGDDIRLSLAAKLLEVGYLRVA